jgi:sodium-dependent dicarboxylate transporter 2/3/5
MTLAASCASMMPMGTPPNAIVFSSGHIRLKDMIKAGLVMNLISIVLIVASSYFILPYVMRMISP